MAVVGKLKVQRRKEDGSKQCRNLRAQGQIPGNIYGHKQAPVPLAVPAADLTAVIKSGARVVDVELEGKSETALLRELQWDYLGKDIVHFDLLRVDPNEKLTVEVRIELKGTAPGTLSGGVLDHTLRTVTVECLATQIPDSIIVKIGTMEIGNSVHVRELEMPPNTRVLNNPEAIVVRVAQPGLEEVLPAPGAVEGAAAQPEVIGRKAAEEGEGEEGAAPPEKEKKK